MGLGRGSGWQFAEMSCGRYRLTGDRVPVLISTADALASLVGISDSAELEHTAGMGVMAHQRAQCRRNLSNSDPRDTGSDVLISERGRLAR
jgi:hypothetical protein